MIGILYCFFLVVDMFITFQVAIVMECWWYDY